MNPHLTGNLIHVTNWHTQIGLAITVELAVKILGATCFEQSC